MQKPVLGADPYRLAAPWLIGLGLFLLSCRGEKKDLPADTGRQDAALENAVKEEGAEEEAEEEEDPRQVLKTRVYTVTLDGKNRNIAYAGATAGVVIYDVGDPAGPSELSTVYLPGCVTSIVQHGTLLLASTGPDGVALIDAGKKDEPVLVAVIKTPGGAWKAQVLGENIIAVADGSVGVTVMDISDRKNPKVTGGWRTEDYVRDIATELKGPRTYIYAACGRQGIVLLEASSRGSLKVLSKLDTGAEIRNLFLEGQRVFAAGGAGGIVIAERKGKELRSLTQFNPGARDMIRGVWVSSEKNTVFLTAGEDGLIFLDVSGEGTVKAAGVFDYKRALNRLVVDGDKAFVAADAGGLLILDISTIPDVKVLYPE